MTTGSRPLVVILHGMKGSPASMAHVARRAQECLGLTEEPYVPKMFANRMSLADPVDIVSAQLQEIDERWASGRYDSVILIGHSAGAVLARKIYVAACGAKARAPLEHSLGAQCANPRPWALKVDRLILLAGMNNGWSIDYHMGPLRALYWQIGVYLARLAHVFTRRWPLIFQMRRGAVFLTQLRIQWLYMRRDARPDYPGGAPVVQLLGTVDDIVSPRDNVDLVTGSDFYFLDVPSSGHTSVVEMDDTPAGRERAQIFENALTWSTDELRSNSVAVGDVNPVEQREDVSEVVFVVHGIRDQGFWTDRIARAVLQEGRRNGRIFARETSTYGYFGMVPFLSSWERKRKVEWLMDRYAEAIARYPNARKFHYVGHSNGTYLLARALQDYSCCQFNHVVFAGSVVRSRYDWKKHMTPDSPRVEKVLNYAANGDWVVACFPNGFEWLGLQDLGGAGHYGFFPDEDSGNVRVKNVEYVPGGHSAALREENWQDIAQFIVHGRPGSAGAERVPLAKGHARLVWALGKIPVLAWIGVGLGVLIVPALLWYAWRYHGWSESGTTLLAVGYFALLGYVGNRV